MQKGISIVQRLQMMGILEECEDACADWGVTVGEAFADTKRRQRSQPIVWARWTVFNALAQRGWSAKAIGDAVGMHHTTVADAIRKSVTGEVPRRTKEKSPSATASGGEKATGPTGKGDQTMVDGSGQLNSTCGYPSGEGEP